MSIKIARELLQMAKEVLPQIKLVFNRSPKADDRNLSAIAAEIQRFVGTVRKNEGLEVIVSRVDNDKEMVLSVGFSDHDAKKAILREVREMAEKLAKKAGTKVSIPNMD